MSKYTVYLRRNLVNGKCYVGQTLNFDRREANWRCLNYYYANNHICKDRAKYGLDNFTVEALAETDSRENAWELEQRFIRDFNTLWPNGYNLDSGGNRGKHPSYETRQKISESHKGEKHPMYGKHHSEETKAKLSKPVYQYTLDGELIKIWPSVRECERNVYNAGAVSQCCNGKKKIYKGYRWSYQPL